MEDRPRVVLIDECEKLSNLMGNRNQFRFEAEVIESGPTQCLIEFTNEIPLLYAKRGWYPRVNMRRVNGSPKG